MEKQNKNIVALVVTYNRKNLLVECLDAILDQTVPINRVVVIDNNSTDGTDKVFLKKKYSTESIIYKKLPENIGGAGGFYEGIKFISEYLRYDYLWLMDDDTIPFSNTVEGALEDFSVLPPNISFLASSVYGTSKEPMNVPVLSKRKHKNGYSDWYRYLSNGLIEIESATFVSLFIKQQAIEKVGLPIKEYFIWGDDVEYTSRLTKYYGPAYFSSKSEVIHKRFNAKQLSLKSEDSEERIGNFWYLYRNRLLNAKKYSTQTAPIFRMYLSYIKEILVIIFSRGTLFKRKKVKAILNGIYQYNFKSKHLKNV